MYYGVGKKNRKILVSPAKLVCHHARYGALKNGLIRKSTGNKSSGVFCGGTFILLLVRAIYQNENFLKVSIIISDGLKKEIPFQKCTEKPVVVFVVSEVL